MSLLADARILVALARGASRDGSHAERLQRFYAPQAGAYDSFRDGLLHGRRELIDRLPARAGDHVIELGAGTGRTLEFFGSRLAELGMVEAIDLCPALLDVARRRLSSLPNVTVVEADVTRYRPAAPADAVYFSYALTMIPDWQAAVDNAIAMLRPGGVVGAVDFYLPTLGAGEGRLSRRSRANRFWRAWFAHDGVQLSQEHLPHLCGRLATEVRIERAGSVPYLPWLRVPHYIFIGRKQ